MPNPNTGETPGSTTRFDPYYIIRGYFPNTNFKPVTIQVMTWHDALETCLTMVRQNEYYTIECVFQPTSTRLMTFNGLIAEYP